MSEYQVPFVLLPSLGRVFLLKTKNSGHLFAVAVASIQNNAGLADERLRTIAKELN